VLRGMMVCDEGHVSSRGRYHYGRHCDISEKEAQPLTGPNGGCGRETSDGPGTLPERGEERMIE